MKLFVKWEKERERWGGAAADPRDSVGTRAHCWLGSRVLRTETPRLHQAHREPQSQLQQRMFCELSLSCPGCFRYLCPIYSYNKLRPIYSKSGETEVLQGQEFERGHTGSHKRGMRKWPPLPVSLGLTPLPALHFVVSAFLPPLLPHRHSPAPPCRLDLKEL